MIQRLNVASKRRSSLLLIDEPSCSCSWLWLPRDCQIESTDHAHEEMKPPTFCKRTARTLLGHDTLYFWDSSMWNRMKFMWIHSLTSRWLKSILCHKPQGLHTSLTIGARRASHESQAMNCPKTSWLWTLCRVQVSNGWFAVIPPHLVLDGWPFGMSW